jgi:hypothetical protein
MSHQQPQPPYAPVQYPPAKRRVWPWILAAAAAVLTILGCIGLIGATTSSSDVPGRDVGKVAGTTRPATTAPAAADGVAARFKPADLSLSVKTTEKACFGSAGCNVQYEIKVTRVNPVATLPESCEITYAVTGLEDTQIGTLTLTNDGTVSQDSYQSGQTTKSSSKLTAKITDMECD